VGKRSAPPLQRSVIYPTLQASHALPRLIGASYMNNEMNSFRDPAIRITLLPRDTNSAGTVFGGVILSYIDMAGAIEAHRHTSMPRFVTVAMREVIFHKPVFVGDLVSFYAETVAVGNTSITIRVIVETERVGSSKEQVRVTEAEVVYVAVDASRKKIPIKKSGE
jgi:acyl-CoA thioesterase YciA